MSAQHFHTVNLNGKNYSIKKEFWLETSSVLLPSPFNKTATLFREICLKAFYFALFFIGKPLNISDFFKPSLTDMRWVKEIA